MGQVRRRDDQLRVRARDVACPVHRAQRGVRAVGSTTTV
ncbi:hypothetical protein I553_9707 [Mycobacterium xenopi 4042]|uniref:Uncharacterized protein n=1 Tax=Mycobacterium xenopi 4042 TaxID=1299334 RepID=X7YPD4_MYCXE|nr:hypothetical protein I553_9707 [Mycobacterium xenopi 4042]